jgi:hypothetical protein
VALAAAGLAPLATSESAPAVVGRWQLNEKESEDAAAKFRPLRPGEDPRQRDREEERDPRDPRSQRARPRPTPSPSPGKLEAPPGLTDFLEPPRTLTIAIEGGDAVLDDGRGNVRRLPLDGVARPDGELTRAARREGASLVLETRNAFGALLATRFNVMAGTRKLEAYSRLAGKDGRAVTLRRVYDEAAQ